VVEVAAGREAVLLRGTVGVGPGTGVTGACIVDGDWTESEYEAELWGEPEGEYDGEDEAADEEAAREGIGAAVWVEDAGTGVLWPELAGTVAGAGTRVAPHMPQKRFVPGLSLPQRRQRTDPPKDNSDSRDLRSILNRLTIIAYDISQLRCRSFDAGSVERVPVKHGNKSGTSGV
jgi:hypothetical protein